MPLKSFKGSCPLCGQQLVHLDDTTVVCRNGNYTISVSEFERIWKFYEPYLKSEGNVATAQLLAALREANTYKEGEQ